MKKSMRFLSFFLAIVLTISMGLPLRFSYAANSEESTTSYTSENPRFGILSVDLQDFKYYGFKKSDKVNYGSNYYKYGAGLKVEWALPADVKEGDAFTLTLPKEVYMDTIPNQSKVFFIIKDKDDQQDIIKVYFWKRENNQDTLRFVATKHAEEKAAGKNVYKGEAIIGDPIAREDLVSYYDISEALRDGQTNIKPQTNIPNYTLDQTPFYQGFRPNKEFFNDSPFNNDTSVQVKDLTYTSQYEDGKVFTFQDSSSVAYKSELYYDGYRYTRFGDFMIQAESEDQDSVTYIILYNEAGTGQAAGKVTKEFKLSNTGFPQYDGHQEPFPTLKPYNGDYKSSMTLYKAAPHQGTGIPKEKTQIDLSQLKETQVLKGQADRWSSTFTFPDDENTYLIRLKMRKIRTVKTPSGRDGYFFAAFQNRRIRRFVIEDFYHGTAGEGVGLVPLHEENIIPSTELTLKKVNAENQPILSNEVNFSLVDTATLHKVEKEVSAQDGTVHFPGLLYNHTYTLTETKAPDEYKKNETAYQIHVDEQGNITWENKDDAVRETQTAGTYEFINRKVNEEAKGTFTVIHKYYTTTENLEKNQNEDKITTIDKTTGTPQEQYKKSDPIVEEGYRLVDVARSHDEIKLGADQNSTEAGNYIKDTDLVVTYRYIKVGAFTETHEYYDSEEALEQATQPVERVENPRTKNQPTTGTDKESFTSEKADKEGYHLAKVVADPKHPEVSGKEDGSTFTANYIPGETLHLVYRYVKDVPPEPETPEPTPPNPPVEEEKGTFQVIHRYFTNTEDLKKDENPDDVVTKDKTEGTKEESYDPSQPENREGYRWVKLTKSHEEIPSTPEGNGTTPGHYVPNENLVVTYYYVKLGAFTEKHEYYASEEALTAGTPEQTIVNPRTEGEATKGTDEESFTSQKHDQAEYHLISVIADPKHAEVKGNADGAVYTHHYIPGETLELVYRYVKDEPTEPEPPEPETPEPTPPNPPVEEEKGTFQVIHRYFSYTSDLDADTNPDVVDTLDKSAGTAEEQFAASNPQEKDDYVLVKMVRSNEEAIPGAEDGLSTLTGHYVPNEDLVVTYYYLAKGRFDEAHQFYDSQSALEAGTSSSEVTNPRTNGQLTSGTDQEQFSSMKMEREGYHLVRVIADPKHTEVAGNEDGSEFVHHYIPHETLRLIYQYVKDEPTTPPVDENNPPPTDPSKPPKDGEDNPPPTDPSKPPKDGEDNPPPTDPSKPPKDGEDNPPPTDPSKPPKDGEDNPPPTDPSKPPKDGEDNPPPTTPEKPQKPGVPAESTPPGGNTPNEQHRAPQTGDISLLLPAASVVTAAAGLFVLRKREKQ